MKSLLSAALVLLTTGPLIAGQPESSVKMTKNPDTVTVTIDGKLFAIYNFGKDLPKPFFSPVLGPFSGEDAEWKGNRIVVTKPGAKLKVRNEVKDEASVGDIFSISNVKEEWLWAQEKEAWVHQSNVALMKNVLTRGLKDPEDHPHHKGIWVSVDGINGTKFWNEDGKIKNVSVELLNAKGNPARMRVVNRWLHENGEPALTETTTVSIYPNRLLAYDITFTASHGKVTFGDTKEGLFGIRMANSMREEEGGTVMNSEGEKGASTSWGRPLDWIDYYGEVDGKTFGITLFDHPLNFRRSRYHVRNYGLFSINPFGEKAYTKGKRPADPVILLPGSSLRLRYGMYLHEGDTKTGNVAETYLEYLK